MFCRIVGELSRGVARGGQVSLEMRVQSEGPERAGDGTESVMMTPGYLWARLMHADVGGGGSWSWLMVWCDKQPESSPGVMGLVLWS